MLNLINELKTSKYNFNYNGYCVEIFFNNYKVVIWETIQDTYYLQILNNKKEKVFSKSYKTIKNVIRYGLSKTYLQ